MTDKTECPTHDKSKTDKAMAMCQLISECVNRFRLVPRILLIAYAYICWETFQWFTGLGPDATTQHVAFASTIWGSAAAWFGLYVNSGNSPYPNRIAMNPTPIQSARANIHPLGNEYNPGGYNPGGNQPTSGGYNPGGNQPTPGGYNPGGTYQG